MVLVTVATVVALLVLGCSAEFLGIDSAWFAFFVVWVPMTWLGTVGRVARPRLPDSYHRLRHVEQDGRLYERLGVGVAKRLLRRGPLAMFNPDLHLPSEPTPERIGHLDQRMRDAEASHAILFALTLVIAAAAMARGWWTTAVLVVVFDILMNGYPVMLQRYNRALLRRRFPAPRRP